MNLNDKSRKELIEEIAHLRRKITKSEQSTILTPTLAEEAPEADDISESEQRFQQALEHVSLLGVSLDYSGKIIFCNAYFLQLTGWQREAVIGQDYFRLFVPKEEAAERRHDFEQTIRGEGFLDSSSRSLLTFSGELRYVNFNSLPLTDNRGEIIGITKVGEDVTERYKVTQALQRSNEAMQDLFDNSNDLIFICSIGGKFLFANRAFKRTLGYNNEELRDINVKDLIVSKYKKRAYRQILQTIQDSNSQDFSTVLRNKNGKSIYLQGNVSVRLEQEQPVAIRGILHNITDKIRAEKSQTLYYSIANLIVKSHNLSHLYQSIHQELAQVIEVRNFYIKLYNSDKSEILFPYYVDEARDEEAKITRRKAGKGLTDYVMRQEKAMFLYEEDILHLINRGEAKLFGPMPKVWIGVPLKFENDVIGLISVKCYRSRLTYNSSDLELLDFISGQIALAIQRKRNEEKLRQQTARLKAIFESSSHIMWSLNRKNQLTSFNQNYVSAMEQQYNIRPMLNSSLVELRQEMERKDTYPLWQSRYEAAFQGKSQHFEIQIPMPNGEQRWREVYLNPIWLDDGRIEEVSAIAHDITEKKHSEIALSDSETKFRSIFESFQDIYYHADLDGTVQLISPSVQEILGYLPEEILGKKISQFVFGRQNTLEEFMEMLKEQERIKNYEVALRSKNGSTLQSISNIRLVYDQNGKAQGIEGVVRDITELKKATEEVLKAKELAEKSLKVKESFLANMSHEIRTPMNGVIGMVDLMMDTKLNKSQFEYMTTIKKSSETLLTILNDILDLSKIEAGKMKLHKKTVIFKNAIEKIHALFLQQAASKQNRLHYEVDEQLPPFVLADETRLLQIISNLTSNAIKFTENGEICIRASLDSKKGKKLWIKIAVEDTGVGIDQENLKLLFNTFSQLDASSSKAHAGTGLGLAISKELCRLMNGKIGVESALGKGSTFWFTFETKASEAISEEEAKDHEPQIREDHFRGEMPEILVIDDNSVNRLVASEILRHSGCKVTLASSGKAGIELVQKTAQKGQNYDLIFMDIQMPDMDGVATTRALRKLGLALPPVVAMTAYSMKEDRQRFLKQGLDDYISKPIKAQALIRKVKEHFFHQKSRHQPNLMKNEKVASPKAEEIIDFEVLAQLKKYGGEELVQMSLQDFEQDTQQLLREIRKVLQTQDYNELRAHLHTLKGNAGTLGIRLLAQLSSKLEQGLKQEVPAYLAKDIAKLEQHFSDFQAVFNEIYPSAEPDKEV